MGAIGDPIVASGLPVSRRRRIAATRTPLTTSVQIG